jgi:hypothetical protein
MDKSTKYPYYTYHLDTNTNLLIEEKYSTISEKDTFTFYHTTNTYNKFLQALHEEVVLL